MDASSCSVAILAATGDDAIAFGPYVPAMAEDGRVAFTTRLRDGRSVVRVVGARRGEVTDFAPTGLACTSHPELDAAGRVVVYAEDDAGASSLVRLDGGGARVLAGPPLAVGPLGPTIDRRGAVAFRATAPDGPGVYVHDEGGVRRVVAPRDVLALHGLPLLDDVGAVLVRADVPGASVVLRAAPGEVPAPVLTAPLGTLGAFPSLDGDDFLITQGGTLVRVGANGVPTRLAGPPRFAFVRGALPMPASHHPLLFATTPEAPEALAIYTARGRLLGTGDALAGSHVAEFALNPVSVNARGQIALRVALVDGRELVLRIDP